MHEQEGTIQLFAAAKCPSRYSISDPNFSFSGVQASCNQIRTVCWD